MSNANLLPSENLSLPPITFKGHPVVTTEMLAHAYGCEAKHIRQNFANNSGRFLEGKHFYNLANEELKEFRLCVENFDSQIVSPKTRNLTLWLERGAARHAKMLNTDKAWDIFELLEETFFRVVQPEPTPAAQPALSRRTDPERKELTALINAWVGCAPVHYAGARSIVNAHFGVKGVDEMTVEQVKEAIQFVQGKIAEAQKPMQALPNSELALADQQARMETLTREIGVRLSECLSLYVEIEDIFTASLPRLSMQQGPARLALASSLRRSSTSYLDSVRCGLEGLRYACKALTCYQA